MKKLAIILFATVLLVLAGCSDGSGDTEKSNDNSEQTTKDKKENEKEKSEDKKEYQIGETATITSDSYDFDYQVTVTDFNLTKEVDKVSIQEYVSGAHDSTTFAVVDVTIKNISDEAYIPNEMFSANLAQEGDRAGDISDDEFFKVGDEELQPGDELKGHLVYVVALDNSKEYTLKYEISSDEETHFILPIKD